ncbi:MAG: hypothetical protein AAFV07_11665, partial [Bacteroidota bacterium]
LRKLNMKVLSGCSVENIYPIMHTAKEGHHILTVHTAQVIDCPAGNRVDIFNGTTREHLHVQFPERGQVHFTIKDCKGEIIQEGQTTFSSQIESFVVPPSGLLLLHL